MMKSSSGGSSSTNTSCQDCGNKAKRDCTHMRCRTCCKSRGFQCSTHVKSTWVPVARRRHKQLKQHQQHQQHHQQHQQHQQQHFSTTTVDHYNQHHHHHLLPLSLSNIHHHHHSSPTSTGVEGGNFPAEVNSLATFRCIRVSSEDNVVDQYAYQTSISIGGHSFKGILYDQGPITAAASRGDDSLSVATEDNHQFNITAATTMAATQPNAVGANLLYHHHPSLYSAPSFNAFLPGMQFFPHPRP